jgi:ubiquinone biosynthesis protein
MARHCYCDWRQRGVPLLGQQSESGDVLSTTISDAREKAVPDNDGTRPPVEPRRSRLLADVVGNIAADSVSRSTRTPTPSPTPTMEDTRAQRRARAVRRALEGLGPFYIKLGQLLSTRPDLISDVMIEELEHLHDSVAISPFGEFAEALDQEVPDWRQLFRSIDLVNPLGSASLAQVYRVILRDGTPAVVKIQRPRIKDRVLQDMKTMRRVARLVGRLAPGFNELIDLDAILQVIFNSMEPELDFTLEAQNMVDARKAVRDFKHLTVPKVLEATPRVLVQSLAPGMSIGAADRDGFSKKERKRISSDLLSFMYQGYFSDYVFHADPHPGNIFVQPGKKATIIDWGMVGRIDRTMGMMLALLLVNIAQNDAPGAARGWIEMGHVTPRADVHGFVSDLSLLVPKISTASLDELNFGVTLSRVLMYSTRRRINTSPHISMVCKSFANIEGSVRNLAPELSMVKVFEKAMVDIVADLFESFFSKKQAGQFALDVLLGSTIALDHLRNILRSLNDKDITVRIGMLEGQTDQKLMTTNNLIRLSIAALIALMWSKRHPSGLSST